MAITETELRTMIGNFASSFNEVQRSLNEENIEIVVGGLDFEENPLFIRFHHIDDVRKLTDRWRRNSRKKPWQLEERKFLKKATDVSYFSAANDASDYKGRLATASSYFPNREEYYEDLIGIGGIHTLAYQNSLFLFNLNFFLRAKYDEKGAVVLTNQPDRICLTCRGGVDGFGRHCFRQSDPKENLDYCSYLALSGYLNSFRGKKDSKRGKIVGMESNGDGAGFMRLSYDLLFEPGFYKTLSREYKKLTGGRYTFDWS